MTLRKLEDFSQLSPEIFRFFMKEEPLLAAGRAGDLNVMTIGWGGLGSLWNKPACTIYVRPTRHSFGFLEREDCFSVNLLSRKWAAELSYCGTVSGRDEDKVAHCGFELAYTDSGVPYVAQSDLVLICKKIYADFIKPDLILDPAVEDTMYPLKDYHRVYTGEVVEVFGR